MQRAMVGGVQAMLATRRRRLALLLVCVAIVALCRDDTPYWPPRHPMPCATHAAVELAAAHVAGASSERDFLAGAPPPLSRAPPNAPPPRHGPRGVLLVCAAAHRRRRRAACFAAPQLAPPTAADCCHLLVQACTIYGDGGCGASAFMR
jgi:hypothetical protein